jgi:hypothetical protein
VTLLGIELSTFRFVAQCLNHCTTACPKHFKGSIQIVALSTISGLYSGSFRAFGVQRMWYSSSMRMDVIMQQLSPLCQLSAVLTVYFTASSCCAAVSKYSSPYKALKAQRGSRGIALLILDLGTRRGWVVSTMPRLLYPWERPSTHCTGGWVGPRAGLNVCEKSFPHQDSIPGPSSP